MFYNSKKIYNKRVQVFYQGLQTRENNIQGV